MNNKNWHYHGDVSGKNVYVKTERLAELNLTYMGKPVLASCSRHQLKIGGEITDDEYIVDCTYKGDFKDLENPEKLEGLMKLITEKTSAEPKNIRIHS